MIMANNAHLCTILPTRFHWAMELGFMTSLASNIVIEALYLTPAMISGGNFEQGKDFFQFFAFIF
jgi:hypothetical protein